MTHRSNSENLNLLELDSEQYHDKFVNPTRRKTEGSDKSKRKNSITENSFSDEEQESINKIELKPSREVGSNFLQITDIEGNVINDEELKFYINNEETKELDALNINYQSVITLNNLSDTTVVAFYLSDKIKNKNCQNIKPYRGLLSPKESKDINLNYLKGENISFPEIISVKAWPIDENLINKNNVDSYIYKLSEVFTEENINLMFTIESLYVV